MTKLSDFEYYTRRLREEQERGTAAADETIAKTHARMADAYRAKLESLRQHKA
jgi:hypothetical protein